DVERVDHQGALRELLRRAGELAEDEHALVLEVAGAVFLGDEVHAVLERGDEGRVTHAVVREELRLAERAERIMNRRPTRATVRPVDEADQAIDLVLQRLVVLDARATRNHDLDERDLLPQLGMALESVPEREDALRDALGVVEAI